jgi:formylglycine-generating enzyme
MDHGQLKIQLPAIDQTPVLVPMLSSFLSFGDSTVVVSWIYTDAHQTGFDVERQVGAGSWSPVGSVDAAVCRYTDSLVLAIGETYRYRVRAVISDNRSEFLASLPVTFDTYRNKVYVEGGTFFMGSDSGEADEKPARSMTLHSFHLEKYEVTVGQYRAFCSATGRVMPWAPSSRWEDDQPIADVGWEDANAYARWAAKRLPTEAEWEYAARGGNKSKGYNYSGSRRLDSVEWYNGNTLEMPRPGGQLGANEHGLYDMSGNVWEWCADWYGGGYYLVSPSNEPKGPDSVTYRFFRGGSYWNFPKYCDVWFRYGYKPSATDMAIGFRCARD